MRVRTGPCAALRPVSACQSYTDKLSACACPLVLQGQRRALLSTACMPLSPLRRAYVALCFPPRVCPTHTARSFPSRARPLVLAVRAVRRQHQRYTAGSLALCAHASIGLFAPCAGSTSAAPYADSHTRHKQTRHTESDWQHEWADRAQTLRLRPHRPHRKIRGLAPYMATYADSQHTSQHTRTRNMHGNIRGLGNIRGNIRGLGTIHGNTRRLGTIHGNVRGNTRGLGTIRGQRSLDAAAPLRGAIRGFIHADSYTRHKRTRPALAAPP
jgi:hypothetical protein